jgi:hypothetical protein
MLISDRRREHLLDCAKWIGKTIDTLELMAIELQAEATPESRRLASSLLGINEEARGYRRSSLLLSLPDGAVEFRGDNKDAIPITRGGVTLVLPSDTPCDVLDALFEIASALGYGSEFGVELDELVIAVKKAAAGPSEVQP